MATKEQLNELVVGGGATGVSMAAYPVGGKAKLPASKEQGDLAPQKLEGDVEETDTQNNTKPTGDMSAKNRATIATKEHIDALFQGQELSEEFRAKAATLFETAVNSRVAEIEADLQEQVEESIAAATEELTEKVDEYLNYVVEQWMEENEVAIDTSLRGEIAEEFMEQLKSLFAENYIEIPEEKMDVLEELTASVEALEEKLNEAVGENVELHQTLANYKKKDVFNQVTEGLALTQVEKLRTLAEGVEFEDEESYKKKLHVVKENYFPGVKQANKQVLSEEDNAIGNNDETEDPNKPKFVDESVKRYFKAISTGVARDKRLSGSAAS